MVMSTQILDEASRLLNAATLVDQLQILDVGEPETIGYEVLRPLTPVGDPVVGLVQSTTLQNAAEAQVSDVFSIKVARETEIAAGQAVKVLRCRQEPDLVGTVLLLDKVSLNGLAMIRKGTAAVTTVVNQEGKEGLK